MSLCIKIHCAYRHGDEAIAQLAPKVKEEPMSKMIFVNLPVRDLAVSTAVHVALGGEVNPQFSGQQSSAVMFSEAIGVMLLTHDHYRQFTQRPIGDARRESQALFALSVDSRDAVNATLTRAAAAGGRADPTRRRIMASCSAAVSRIPTGMSGRSCGWTPPHTPRRSKARDRNSAFRENRASGSLRAPFPLSRADLSGALGGAAGRFGNRDCGNRHPRRSCGKLNDVTGRTIGPCCN
jgi:predicted lactoylglutathione lyase